MEKIYDLTDFSTEDKINILKARYGGKLIFAGRRHGIVERIISLNKNTKPNPEKLAAMEGIWALTLAQKYDVKVKYLVICPEQIKTIESQKLIDYFIDRCESTIVVSERVFEQISEKENAQGLMAVLHLNYRDFEDFKVASNSVLIILDGLEIPGNIGTILRSAEAVNCDGVILTNRKVRINHPKLLRSSMGSIFKVPVYDVKDTDELINKLLDLDYEIILSDTASGRQYFEPSYGGRIALVMGSEKYGISDHFYNRGFKDVMIPMMGDMDSLNVGVAATILMYEIALKNKGIIKRN